MDWITWGRWRLNRRHIGGLVEQIADRCRGLMLQKVFPQIGLMTVAEARGYVRARSNVAVARQAAIAVAEIGLPKEMVPGLALVAKEELIRQVVAEARNRRPATAWRKAA
jgi:hypothetical protein